MWEQVGQLCAHHGALSDAEDADQVDRVGGMPGLVQDAVLAQPVRADAERLDMRIAGAGDWSASLGPC